MNQALKQTPGLRDRFVEVLREHHEVKHIGALADKLEAALPAADPVSSIVPDHCSGAAMVFEGGCLHVRKDGSGYIVVDENDFVLEDDRCEGEHGPEGSIHWIARFPAGEMTALRDFLNGQQISSLSTQARDVATPSSINALLDMLAALENARELLEYGGFDLETIDRAISTGRTMTSRIATPSRQPKDLDQLDTHLQTLIDADLHKARMASNNEDLRLWFVAELISEASGRVPLLEIEGLVARRLAAVQGGEA